MNTAEPAEAGASGSASGSAKMSLNRVPTLTFPPLHLGSFNDFDASTLSSAPEPSTSTSASSLRPSSTVISGRYGSRGSATSADHRPLTGTSISEGSNSRTLRPASRESRESTRSRASIRSRKLSSTLSGPASPPPTGALPPLPTSSEHSPVSVVAGTSPSTGTFGAAQAAAQAHITGNFASQTLLDRSTLDRSTTPTASEPVLRDSPIPRRRTLIQQPETQAGSRERQVSMVLDDIPLVPSPLAEQSSLPGPNGTSKEEHKLEKRPSTNDLRASPTSPKKRSLPRPPSEMQKPALEIVTALPAAMPQQVPTQRNPAIEQQRAAPSASTLPIIAGLADAGPYSFNKPSGQGPPGLPGLGRPPQAQARQEEVCLECMMRDQDLADVDVSTPGVWGRASDAGLDELRWREESLLASMGNLRLEVREMGTSDESSGPSPPSTTNSLEEAEARRKEASRQRREAVKARKREADYRVAREIGWRGFKWEEGTAGEGLPRGFRGTKPGKLTEEGIKAVMIKFPSASALRYNNLQNYLRNQYTLVMDVAAEASRVGYFAPPPEVGYDEEQQERIVPVPAPMPPAVLHHTPIRGSSVKPSPSSPADLSAIAGRPLPARATPARPLTHYIPEREPRPADHSLRPTLTSLSTSPGQYISDIDYSPISPADSGVRPFSFAVRAGATGHGMGESEQNGNGRRSFFGRWGGSVTSFFGGSQGGSGSMMDMHIGLDSERRNRTSSFNVHSQPRAVSLASPTRPSFFSRDSRDSTRMPETRPSRDLERNTRARGQSLSASRLSQVIKHEDEVEPEPKKKGLKGLIKRMRGKSVSAKTPPAMSYDQFNTDLAHHPRPPQQRQDSTTSQQLAPPPPLSYLVGRGDKHARNRSGSSSSMVTDASGLPVPVPSQQYGNRSVSAPLADTSSGDVSASPTSSRFDRARDSYNSRRQMRYSRDEQANGMDFAAPPQGPQGPQGGQPVQAYAHPTGMPHNASYRSGNKTASSMSASSVVETPPPVHMPLAYPQHVEPKYTNGPMLSPNRFKNLPPLPADSGSSGRPSPNPDEYPAHAAHMPLHDTFRSVRTARSSGNLPQPLYQPVQHRPAPERASTFQEQARARASYDTGETRRVQQQQMYNQTQQQRMAQSMYLQNPPNGYGYAYPDDAQGRYDYRNANGRGEGDEMTMTTPKAKEKRKGLKGLFGGSKAGRLA